MLLCSALCSFILVVHLIVGPGLYINHKDRKHISMHFISCPSITWSSYRFNAKNIDLSQKIAAINMWITENLLWNLDVAIARAHAVA